MAAVVGAIIFIGRRWRGAEAVICVRAAAPAQLVITPSRCGRADHCRPNYSIVNKMQVTCTMQVTIMDD